MRCTMEMLRRTEKELLLITDNMLSIQTHEVSSENTPILTAIVISNIRHILDITNITCRYKDFFNFLSSVKY